ncbi:hypothetical protein M3J09_005817 [Ascochyta lentis]
MSVLTLSTLHTPPRTTLPSWGQGAVSDCSRAAWIETLVLRTVAGENELVGLFEFGVASS